MLTDEQLMEQLKQGVVAALGELYKKYSKRLLVFCRNITGCCKEDAEDLVHHVFMRVLKNAHSFNLDFVQIS
ncbi:MAG: hypothetical protein HY808_04895 [Nitrospirae bacterium]|nr:hypothetical protein [Nitrospirota bacterium]